MPRRVVLLTRDASLAVAVKALLADDDRVTELESPQELPAMGDLPVDVLVVDLPGSSRAATLERVRGRFSGPLVVLLGHGEDPAKARGVDRCSVLARPFGMSQLWPLLAESAAEAVTEVIPAVERYDPSRQPSPGAEGPPDGSGRLDHAGAMTDRPVPAAERREGGPGRSERPVPASEHPRQSPEPAPERPVRVADQPELAPKRQARPQMSPQPAAPLGERPREPTGPPGPQASPGQPQRLPEPPGARPSAGAPPPVPARPAQGEPSRDAPPARSIPPAAAAAAAAARPQGIPDRPAPAASAAREGESGAARAAAARRGDAGPAPSGSARPGAAGPASSGKENRKPPPWNWRWRRFNQPSPAPVDPGALTQPMPRVQLGSGVPPAPGRPAPPPERTVNGGQSVTQPGDPAQRVDRTDHAAAVERRDTTPSTDRPERAQPTDPALDRRDAVPAVEPREPAVDRRDPAPPVDRRDPAPPVDRPSAAPATGLEARPVDPGPPVPPVPPAAPAPKLDRPAGAAAEPRQPDPAAEREDPLPSPDVLMRGGEAPPRASASQPEHADEVLPDPPEAVAGRLAERLGATTVALLLDNNHGLLEVAGGVGLTPAERQLQVEYGHEVLLELFRVGVGLIEDTERVRGLIRGIPGCNSQSLVMVPLVHEGHGFGALIIGRSNPPGQPHPEFSEPEIEALMDFADDVAAPLRSTVLLRRLKRQLDTPNRP